MKRLPVPLAYTLTGLFLAAVPHAAGSIPVGYQGPEIWVDGPAVVQPGSDRIFPDVAMDPEGLAIHVWSAFIPGGSQRHDVFLRRFDLVGNPLADPVQVNTLVEDDQLSPRVAVGANGSFLVILQSDEVDPDAGGAVRRWVRGQAFDADADPVGNEQLISPVSSDYVVDIHADVAALTGGGYVVAWAQNNPQGSDTNRNIQARRVAATGAPDGNPFVVNSSIGASETEPAVTELDGGGFLVVWTTGTMIWGREFDASGIPQGSDVQLSTFAQGGKFNPDAVRGIDGRILVVWEDAEEPGDAFEVRGRMLTSALAPLGDDFRINVLTEGEQRPSRAGSYGVAGFLVAWASDVSAGDDLEPDSIQGRIVTGNNQFAGPQFQLNLYTAGNQSEPAVGGMGGHVSVAWRSSGNEAQVNEAVIVGQTLSICGIFCNGFE